MASCGQASLVLVKDGKPVELSLNDCVTFRIGRSVGNDLVLPDDRVSRFHACIEARSDGYHLLSDSGSRNGTFLNGARVTVPAVLKDGDAVLIGSQALTYRLTGGEDRDPLTALEMTRAHTEVSVVTTLVVDLRGFTQMSNQLDTATLSAIVSVLWRDATAALQECGAWDRRALGDGLLGIWKHREADPPPEEIVPVLLALVRLVKLAGQMSREQRSPVELNLGAAVATGEAMIGHTPAGENSALGETVNRAFRLQAATRRAGCDCLVATATWRQISFLFPRDTHRRHELQLKGYQKRVPAYALSFSEIEEALARRG